MHPIRLNFLPFQNQNFDFPIYRRRASPGVFNQSYRYYDLPDENGENVKFEITDVETLGFEPFLLPSYLNPGLVSKNIYTELVKACSSISGFFILNEDEEYNRQILFEIESHTKGRKCIWIEPYFLKSKQKWGILIGYRFIIDERLVNQGFRQDRDIQIASGSLNSRGGSNLDFYLFKHEKINRFIKTHLPLINQSTEHQIEQELFELSSFQLDAKDYVFKDNKTSNSSFLGLSKNSPLESPSENTIYQFIYNQNDRDFAVLLLKGLRGELYPNTFSGIEKLFRCPFGNDKITGVQINNFTDDTINPIIEQIKTSEKSILPIIITNAKKDQDDDRTYYWLKSKFTNEGIPCQVVTKDLIKNENAIKYSLSNIALQIFSKAGGKPWKMKPAANEYLIIGIGQSYNIEKTSEGNSIEKNITYSVLTDSSGIFKDLMVLSEGIETDNGYYQELVSNISKVINNSGYKRIAIHVPFRISKEKVLSKVISSIPNDVELNVLVINNKTNLFGFDYNNNGLVPFESTFLKIANDEYLVWFEGLQLNNTRITKRYGNPLLIKFWFSNNADLLKDYRQKEVLLQDCINLSGANWRGFKSKQLPVSVFYCQRIAEFISKFREYHLEHIDINNLKPWFL